MVPEPHAFIRLCSQVCLKIAHLITALRLYSQISSRFHSQTYVMLRMQLDFCLKYPTLFIEKQSKLIFILSLFMCLATLCLSEIVFCVI